MEAESRLRAWGSPREAWALGCLPGGLFRLAWRTPASATVSYIQSPYSLDRLAEPQSQSLALVLPPLTS